MRPVCLFSDFGVTGPYVGQMKAALFRQQPALPVLDLMADAPNFDAKASAYLLAALLPHTPPNAVVLAVVDPGVGSARLPVVVEIDGRILVGPDNGLFAIACRRAGHSRCRSIAWRPPHLSASFHGRDLFAPVAAILAAEMPSPPLFGDDLDLMQGHEWPDDLPRIIYVDHYGNAITGLRGHMIDPARKLRVGEAVLSSARTFADVPVGTAFWYVNSIGLVEFSVNQGNASRQLSIELADCVF
ncbi:SAM hydrolase/SAM-dependent halogenase family protein [Magnetospirillum sulfuroxidans]|uniref:SAM-dependent chlorinase/fluorinase n=1 Tax=Magnetospirillum sulfuroxidans TaxID=611300 RepID=A0ABS5I8F3_9PROT|nr:SAM-dependent chlorinase/fluorinase [Magnetospirillum sulfuroxidans]MBR9970437.1 SAM-dependent chlorinase/fluorinase [Magnetospirillum sulfuroxidans]